MATDSPVSDSSFQIHFIVQGFGFLALPFVYLLQLFLLDSDDSEKLRLLRRSMTYVLAVVAGAFTFSFVQFVIWIRIGVYDGDLKEILSNPQIIAMEVLPFVLSWAILAIRITKRMSAREGQIRLEEKV